MRHPLYLEARSKEEPILSSLLEGISNSTLYTPKEVVKLSRSSLLDIQQFGPDGVMVARYIGLHF